MENQIEFHNPFLLEDMTNGVLPLPRYHFHCVRFPNGIFKLVVYPPHILQVDEQETAKMVSYVYQKQAALIQDLENWAIQSRVALKAIVTAKAQAESPSLQLTFENGREMPKDLSEIVACVAFWNREGLSIYENNIYGQLGSTSTQQAARKTAFDDWMLNAILADCNVFVQSQGLKYKTGRGGHHVWISEGDERFVMIHL